MVESILAENDHALTMIDKNDHVLNMVCLFLKNRPCSHHGSQDFKISLRNKPHCGLYHYDISFPYALKIALSLFHKVGLLISRASSFNLL